MSHLYVKASVEMNSYCSTVFLLCSSYEEHWTFPLVERKILLQTSFCYQQLLDGVGS